MKSARPAVVGWFTTEDKPTLLGNKCTVCGTVFFPKASFACRHPDCDGMGFAEVQLSRIGRVWSYTDAQYQPPPPFVSPTADFVPFALAAVELVEEQMVVLGQVAAGFGVDELCVGAEVELVVETLYSDEEHDYLMYRWRPTGGSA